MGERRGDAQLHPTVPCRHRVSASPQGRTESCGLEGNENEHTLFEHRFVHTEGSNVFLGANKAQGEANNTVVIGCLWRASQTKLHWFVLL